MVTHFPSRIHSIGCEDAAAIVDGDGVEWLTSLVLLMMISVGTCMQRGRVFGTFIGQWHLRGLNAVFVVAYCILAHGYFSIRMPDAWQEEGAHSSR